MYGSSPSRKASVFGSTATVWIGAKNGDHPLARVDRHVVEAIALSIAPDDRRDGRQKLDRRLDVVLERRRQRHGDAVIRPRQQLLADPDGEVARAVDDRQGPHSGTD